MRRPLIWIAGCKLAGKDLSQNLDGAVVILSPYNDCEAKVNERIQEPANM